MTHELAKVLASSSWRVNTRTWSRQVRTTTRVFVRRRRMSIDERKQERKKNRPQVYYRIYKRWSHENNEKETNLLRK